MKNFLWICALMLGVAFSGCTKKEEPVAPMEPATESSGDMAPEEPPPSE